MSTESEYQAKIKLANIWSDAYYNGNPIATDEEFDNLIKELAEYEITHQAAPDSPTLNVGYEIDRDARKVKRKVKMYSLNNVYNLKELKEWLLKIQKYLNNSKIKFTVSPKFDGVSMDVVYKHGEISVASTRGDGLCGELITENAKSVFGVGRGINIKEEVSVRGEVVVEKSTFERVRQEVKSSNGSTFSNPRNYASGSLRLLDSSKVKERELVFIPWGVVSDKPLDSSYYKSMRKIYFSHINFEEKYFVYFNLCLDIDHVMRVVERFQKDRNKFNVELDGCVITVDDITLQKKLGYTAKAPRFSIAYKFPPTEVATTLIGVEPRVADTGVITPVGLIQPVTIDGKVIKKVTLHNYNHISEKDIRINDKVSVILSGEVIPKIVNVFKDRRTGKEIEIKKPTICFTCGNPVKEVGAKIVCENCKK